MADDEKDGKVTYVVNLMSSPITARVLSDKSVVTEEYVKLFSSTEQSVKEANGYGVDVGVPEVGDLGVKYDTSSESQQKEQSLKEGYKKLQHYLQTAGFVTIAPFRSLRFSTAKRLNYVTIFVDGILKCSDNWNTSDAEVYVDHDATIGSNTKVKIAPYYDDDLFSHAFQAKMVDALEKFKELYRYAKSSDGAKVVSGSTSKEIAQCGVDFIGMNFASSELLSIVAQRWFGASVKRLYAFGVEIETMPKDEVAYLLKEISQQALDLSDAWETLAGWYMQMSDQIEKTIEDIIKDNKDAEQAVKDIREAKQKELDERLQHQHKWGTGAKIGLGILTLGAAVPAMNAHNERMDEINEKFRSQLDDAVKGMEEIAEVVNKIENLSKSLDEMTKFCKLMAAYFQLQFQNFKNWGSTHATQAADIGFLSWSPEKCATWIIDLNRASFQSYETAIQKKLVKKKRGGSELKKINAEWLEDVCDVEPADAAAMEAGIKGLTVAGEVQYKFVKKTWDDDVKWMETQQKSIESVNKFLLRIQINAAFIEKGVVPTMRKAVVLKTFKNVEISPQKSAQKILQ
eukprot:CAMPEP_0202703092 /NCGR_PEP_ID=MMETSP1385-20130828/15975_1 /ASSEMBLY_ACC=CAM_ASM_000861 /TAXON_ID=933848 /ORGANISM="Elphidium margaritaceum" /LENGTH=570 /DNA_ID=CAMNT_0049360885 /DNA_START=71 /DNA_END=1783 /DNA_ORIENTATION=-